MKLHTLNGAEVYVPMEHLNQHTDVIPHLKGVLGLIDTGNQTIVKLTLDVGYVVGKSDLVATDENDVIVHATRTGRGWPTRFAKNRESVDCSFITCVLKRQGFNKYRMLTAYVGLAAEKEVGDFSIRTPEERARSEQFWANHALVWGSQEVEDGINPS